MGNYQFTDDQKTEYQNYVREYIQGKAKSAVLPQGRTDLPWAKKYVTKVRSKGKSSVAGTELSMQAPNNALDETDTEFLMCTRQLSVQLTDDKINGVHNPLLDDSVKGTLAQIVQDAEYDIFSGNDQIDTNIGIIPKATSETLADATITAFGDIVVALNEHLAAIPGRYKDMGVNPIVFMTPGLYQQLFTNISTNKDENEFSVIQRELMNDKIEQGYRIGGIYNCKYLWGASTTALTTNQIMCTLIPDKRILEVITSRPLGITKSIELPYGIDVGMAWGGAAVVRDANAVIKTASITTSVAGSNA
jgi:hypothetical protein